MTTDEPISNASADKAADTQTTETAPEVTKATAATSEATDVKPAEEQIKTEQETETKEIKAAADADEAKTDADAAETPVQTTSSSEKPKKPSNIFNSFNSLTKSLKRTSQSAAPSEDQQGAKAGSDNSAPIAKDSALEKKKSKGFGTFLQKAKSNAKAQDEPTAHAADPVVELPKIEHLQPIETSAVTDQPAQAAAALAESAANAVETAVVPDTKQEEENKPSEESADATASSPKLTKRHSLISKLFGANNKKKTDASSGPLHEQSEQPEQAHGKSVEQTPTVTADAPASAEEDKKQTETSGPENRSTSPFGKFTDLFAKLPKGDKKSSKTAQSEETAANDNLADKPAGTEATKEVEQPASEEQANATAAEPVAAPSETTQTNAAAE